MELNLDENEKVFRYLLERRAETEAVIFFYRLETKGT